MNMTFWRSKHWRACSVEFSEVPVIIAIALKKQRRRSLPLSSLLFVLNCGVVSWCGGVLFFLTNLSLQLFSSGFRFFEGGGGWFFFFKPQSSFHN